MEAFGRYLVAEPYLATVVLAGGIVALLGLAVPHKAGAWGTAGHKMILLKKSCLRR